MRLLPRKNTSIVTTAAMLCLYLTYFCQSAAGSAKGIVLENWTYSPLHYRIRTPTGSYSSWRIVLPGNTYHYRGYSQLNIEVWFSKNRSKEFALSDKYRYSLDRAKPRSETRFVHYSTEFTKPPQPPGADGEFLGPRIFAGTVWVGKENLRGFGRLEFRFHDENKVTMVDAANVSSYGFWSCEGNQITLNFPSAKCVYTGLVTGKEMYGRAGKSKWHWTATRQGDEPLRKTIIPKNQFAPLEKFVAACNETKQPYKLSLKKLAEDCSEADKKGALPDELRYVRGFTWFFGYFIDDENGDVELLGVKDTTRPPIHVDSLVTAIKCAYSGAVPYCSLEPDGVYKKSIVKGVPWNTRYAEVMIEADYEMGKIARGLLKPPIPGFLGSQDQFAQILFAYGLKGEVETVNGRSTTVNRWWFNFDSKPRRTVADATGKLLYLFRNPIQLSTEQEIGGKYGTGKTTLSNRRFVDAFNLHMTTIGKHYPSIAELQALYRLYDLMKHVREVGQTAVPEMDYWVTQYKHSYDGPPVRILRKVIKRELKVRKNVPRLLVGSSFSGTESLGGYSRLRFDLHRKAKVTMYDKDGATQGSISRISGNNITLSFYRGTVVYRGVWSPTQLSGTASNGKKTWTWKMDTGHEPQTWTSGLPSNRNKSEKTTVVYTTNGRLDHSCYRDRVRTKCYCKTYYVRMQSGQTYVIDLKGKNLDTYLRLEDPYGRQVGSDDDGGDGLNSRLRFTAKQSGSYRVVATSYAAGTGEFQLRVGRVR